MGAFEQLFGPVRAECQSVDYEMSRPVTNNHTFWVYGKQGNVESGIRNAETEPEPEPETEQQRG